MSRAKLLVRYALKLLLLLMIVAFFNSRLYAYSLDPPLYELVKMDLPITDVAVLFDISGSMKGAKFSQGSEYIIGFIESLSNKEYLHFRPFAGDAYTPLEMSGDEASMVIRNRMPKVTAEGTGTDIHLAIMKAIEFFRRPDANKQKALIIITDGFHQPPAVNRKIPIRELKDAADAISNLDRLSVYTVELGQYADIGLIKDIFSSDRVERVVNATPEAIGERLERLRYSIRFTAIKELVNKVLDEGFVNITYKEAKSEKAGGFSIEILFANRYEYLPVVLNSIPSSKDAEVASQGFSYTISGIKLGSVIDSDTQLKGTLNGLIESEYSKWKIPRKDELLELPIAVDTRFEFLDKKALQDLGFNEEQYTPKVSTENALMKVKVSHGIPIWKIALMITSVIVMVVGAITLKFKKKNSSFFGYLFVDGMIKNLEMFNGEEITLRENLRNGQEVGIAVLRKAQEGNNEIIKIFAHENVRLIWAGREIKNGKALMGEKNAIVISADVNGEVKEIKTTIDLKRRNVFYRPILLIVGIVLVLASIMFLINNSNSITIV